MPRAFLVVVGAVLSSAICGAVPAAAFRIPTWKRLHNARRRRWDRAFGCKSETVSVWS